MLFILNPLPTFTRIVIQNLKLIQRVQYVKDQQMCNLNYSLCCLINEILTARQNEQKEHVLKGSFPVGRCLTEPE